MKLGLQRTLLLSFGNTKEEEQETSQCIDLPLVFPISLKHFLAFKFPLSSSCCCWSCKMGSINAFPSLYNALSQAVAYN